MDVAELAQEIRGLDVERDRRWYSALVSDWLHPGQQGIDARARAALRDVIAPLLLDPSSHERAMSFLAELGEQWILGSRDDSCLTEIADWLDETHVTLGTSLRLANRIAWATRGLATPIADLVAKERDPSSVGALFLVATSLERRRFLFQGSGLLEAIDELSKLSGYYASTTYVRAMRAFALLLGGTKHDVPQALASVEEAWADLSEPDAVGAVRDVCLHALWVGSRIPDQGEVLLRYCNLDAQTAHSVGLKADRVIVLFRKAGALRMLGRYEEAIEILDALVNRLHGSSEFVRTFSEQVIREREINQLGMSLDGLKSDFDVARERLEATEEKMKRSEARLGEIEHQGLTRNVQIISMFTAAVAFAVGIASISTKTGSSPLAAVLVSCALGVGLLG
ncbi:MAG TPA: hypothetical protein PLS29_09485, partial [Acidimicrobiales bacterium]|nr:hypothetical protein [Acidimicrobiales bacterium]